MAQEGGKADDFRIARRKMVKTQLEGRDIRDPRVLEAMLSTPRHFFVDEALALQAYSDGALPIGYGQTISQPYIVAYMSQTLNLQPTEKVLEIGFGSGYQTAVLAALAGQVFAVERLEPLFRKGQANLARLGLKNIRLKLDDGTLGWPEQAPFDAILVAAGGPKIPPPLAEQLAPGGRLIIPVGSTLESQTMVMITKASDGQLHRRALIPCRFVSLIGRYAH